ncbi:MAG: hypothetical protein R6U62_01635 [Bacteroidales bacterium]
MKKKPTRLLSGLCFICFCLFLIPSLALGQTSKQYKFTNKHGEEAKDLHIKISPAVQHNPETQQHPVDPDDNTVPFPEVHGEGSTTMGFGKGLTGNGVPAGGDVVFTFDYDGSTPRIIRWWWTKSGDPNDLSNANRLGPKNYPRRGEFTFTSLDPSAGDGLIHLTVDDEMNTFDMPADLSSEQATLAFKAFVEDQFLFADATLLEATKVEIISRAHSNQIDDILVNVIPDSNMEVVFKYLPEVIPTLTEWGVIILVLLLMAGGVIFLYKRQASLAYAKGGGASAQQSNTFLFNKRLFAKVFAITLIAAVAFLGLTYLIAGKITPADPPGAIVSAAIIAYMIHYIILQRNQE